MFDFAEYSKKMPKAMSSFTCMYCGAENITFGGVAFCTNCESMADITAKNANGTSHANAMGEISAHDRLNEYEESAKIYEQLFDKENDPVLLYAEALVYIRYSNYEISKISYDREGFMEENSMLNHHASELTSKAKLLLAKCSNMLRSSVMQGDAKTTAYHLFLAYLKFGDMAAAKRALDNIKELKDNTLYEYASMLLDSGVGDFNNLLARAEMLLKANWQPHIVLYYAAYALFKRGRARESKEIVKAIQTYIRSENIGHMARLLGQL